ncbi:MULTISPECIES: Fe-S cluster assembly protein SufD [Staphylococcus]|jgi:Fe-S cluster assembly protein SufD|uniref:Fe-S cluster assembly protein SufD n=2 Tax=Staphylococcus haemolyticus TaxID=1283 RepID=A0A2A1K876_STAHA|nr:MULTISPECIES: Fe-S cluster assembly protein SufD [Staphylococcus]KDP52658.1 FeS assembly protein SufD [Staphylococcus aureus subsp. aureus CO-98]MDU2097407.1 Fe-S cluster assembly protein SufD [Staphylococcus sp.]AKC76752.1 ABC superfamily ATP binding cassette transporter, membrane protein [Staphylococcus haemolyticus]AMW22930.1 Fe-S cluster assembly protein SufD [Staphylococcus haemolyticus]AUV68008.1 Fe-S cluster assembly protein SufD [Staphylococcus haemolyticus]
MTTETLNISEEQLVDYSKAHNEPSWMTELRQKALKLTETLEMPKPDKTKLRKWDFDSFKQHEVKGQSFSNLSELPEAIKKIIDVENTKNLVVQHNNALAYTQVSDQAQKNGVIIEGLSEALINHGELVQKYLMTDAVSVDEHRLTALHTALINGGVFVYVPKNVVVEDPIQYVVLHDDDNASFFNHVIIVTEESAEVTYVENYLSTASGEGNQLNIVSEVIAGANSNITYGSVDYLDKGFTGHIIRRGTTAADASINWALGLMNEGSQIIDNTTNLIGDRSTSELKSVVVGTGDQKINLTSKIVQYGKETNGYILKHGVMRENASSVFNGIGYIKHGGTKSIANQESRVLMLSENARGDANPILLIDEDDVEAGHAASVGRVDPEQLYYLMSRGISQKEAERLVIHGFLDPVVRELPIEDVKRQLREVIELKVNK